MTTVNSQNNLHDPKLPLTAHLEELRKRLMITMGGIFVAFVTCWGFSQQIIEIVSGPALQVVDSLQFDTLTDPFFSHLKAAFFAAVFLTFPLTITQIWLFVRPALYKKEKHVVWPFLLCSYPLFVGGALFFYFLVFPIAVEFLANFDKSLVPSLRLGDYLSLTIRMLFVFGLIFEMPLISLLLTRMGFLTARKIARSRRYSIVIIFIVAAVLTPPDPLSQLLMAGPLLVLFEVSIVVSWLAQPRGKDKETEEEQEEK